MIFSKDKKPTQPGWYWYTHREGEPQAAEVWDIDGNLVFQDEVPIDADWMDVIWGDRIETPSVEIP